MGLESVHLKSLFFVVLYISTLKVDLVKFKGHQNATGFKIANLKGLQSFTVPLIVNKITKQYKQKQP